MKRAFAPYRVSLFSGGSDLPEYFRHPARHGSALSIAIQDGVVVTIGNARPGDDHKDITDTPIVEAYKKRFYFSEKVWARSTLDDIVGENASGLGLGTSSSLAVALCKAHRPQLTPTHLVRLARQIEVLSGATSIGWQDQVAASHGGMNYMQFFQGSDGQDDIILTSRIDDHLMALSSRLWIYYTGVSRSSRTVLSSYAKAASTDKTAIITEQREMCDRAVSAIYDGDYDTVGRLLSESWALKRSVSPEVSTPEIDGLIRVFESYGFKAKLVGAGGGGFIVVYHTSFQAGHSRLANFPGAAIPVTPEFRGAHIL